MSETRAYYKTRLRGRGQITLPPQIRERLQIREGDDVLFRLNEQGQVVVEQVRMIDPEQAWFWTEKWQKMEAESRQDYENGNYVEFDEVEKAINYLHEYANAKTKV